MHTVRPAQRVDWTVIAIRLLFFGGLAVWLVLNLGVTWLLSITILMAILTTGNGLALAFVGQSRQELPLLQAISVAGDSLFVFFLLAFSHGQDINLSFIGLLPLISASVYYGWLGVVVVACANSLILGWLALSTGSVEKALISAALVWLICFGIGSALAYMCTKRPAPQPERVPRQPERQAVEQSQPGSERLRQRLIYNLISSLSSSLNYERVLEAALDLSTSTLMQLNASADQLKCSVLMFKEGEDPEPELYIAASRRFLPSDTRITIRGSLGLVGKAIEAGKPTFSGDVNTDIELSHFISMHECLSGYCIPLRAGLETFGVLLFVHPESDFFDLEKREVLDIVGNQSMIAMQNARLYRDLEMEKERMMDIQEEARKKMARDLHDGPTQSIAAIAMRVNFARRLMERDMKAAAEELFKIEDMARRTTKEIRHMLFTLRPLVLESQGLVAALESMAEKMRETYNQQVSIEADFRVVELLEMTKQAIVFFIAEEAVNNARKHAQAENIWLRLRLLKDGLCLLEIEDDGKGFDLNAIDSTYHERSSLGLINMRERSELVNGVLHLESTPGRGTLIQLVIPVTEEAADQLRRLV